MILLKKTLPISLALVFWGAGLVLADYTIILKNGRRITVKEYREDGSMIKVRGMGGEFGIAKDQIDSIIDPGRDEEKGMVVPEYNRFQPEVTNRVEDQRNPSTKLDGGSEAEMRQKNTAAKSEQGTEDEAYLRKIKEKTEELKKLQDRYAVATRGSSGTQSGILEGKDAIKGRTADLQSRLKDAQRSHTSGPSGAPRVDVAPQAYSDKEKELSQLRKQIVEMQNERDSLIKEMQQKTLSPKP